MNRQLLSQMPGHFAAPVTRRDDLCSQMAGASHSSAQQHTHHERSLQTYFSCFCLVGVGFVALSVACTVCSNKTEPTKHRNDDRGTLWPMCASFKCSFTQY